MAYITPKLYYEINKYFENYHPQYIIPFNLTVTSGLRIFETGLKRSKGVTTSKTGKKYKKNTKKVIPSMYYPIEDRCAIQFKGKRNFERTVPTNYDEQRLREHYEQKRPRAIGSYTELLKRRWNIGTHDGRRTFCINFFQLHGSGYSQQQDLIALTGHKNMERAEPYLRGWRQLRVGGVFTESVMKDIETMMQHIKV